MSVLILAYYSIKDPVCRSAVLQYFKAYAELLPCNLILVTFENDRFPLSSQDIDSAEKELSRHRITWYRLTWRSGNFKVLKKVYDVLESLWHIKSLKKNHSIKAIYSEGFPGAIIGYLASSLFNLSHIIHSFEPHADYMLEAGVWTRSSWEYKLLKYFEHRVALHCSSLLTATDSMIENIAGWGVPRQNMIKVPSCIDTDLFKPDVDQRKKIRKRLGFDPGHRVVVYLGKIDGMYWAEELFRSIKSFISFPKCTYRFLILNYKDHMTIRNNLNLYGVDPSYYQLISVDHDNISHYLSAGDIGLVAVRQKPSKKYCSPIKTGEYLACGLPVIVPYGISDDYLELKRLGIGVIVKDTSAESLDSLPFVVYKFLKNRPRELISKAARQYAIEHRGLHNYTETFRGVFLDACEL